MRGEVDDLNISLQKSSKGVDHRKNIEMIGSNSKQSNFNDWI